MAAATTEHGALRHTTRVRFVIRSFAWMVLAAIVAATGLLGTVPAGASTPNLAQRVLALAGKHGASGPEAARIAQAPNISKVTTASGSATATTPTVSSTTVGISATYTGTTLVVSWAGGNTLTVAGAGPLSAGSTITSLNFGTGQLGTGTVDVGGSLACSAPPGLIGVVTIDQLITAGSGAVTTLALQFACATSLVGFVVTGTVGLNVPASTRSPGYNLYEGDGTVSSSASLGNGSVNLFFGVDIFGDLSGAPLNQPVVGMATTSLDGGYWLVGRRRRGVLLRRCQLLRLDRQPPPQPAGGRHGRHPRRQGLLAGLFRRRHLLLRRRRVPRVDGRPSGLDQADGGDRHHRRRQGLLDRRLGRRHLLLRRRRASTARRAACTSTNPSWGWRPCPAAGATGWWAPTAGIFSFGDAGFHGSAGSIALNSPIVGMAAAPERQRLLARCLRRRRVLLRCSTLRWQPWGNWRERRGRYRQLTSEGPS